MAQEKLTGKDIFLMILTSMNTGKSYYSKETIWFAVEQYNELIKLPAFSR